MVKAAIIRNVAKVFMVQVAAGRMSDEDEIRKTEQFSRVLSGCTVGRGWFIEILFLLLDLVGLDRCR